MPEIDNREILVRTASALFRQKGYSGVGLNEILNASDLPKGSLYYHFPGGKCELADAATRWAGEWVERTLDKTFGAAPNYETGTLAVCEVIARAVVAEEHVPACPVLSILQAALSEPALRKTAVDVYDRWTDCIEGHAVRFGIDDPRKAAFSLHIRLQGAWIVAFAQQSNAPFLMLAGELREALPR